MPSRRPPAVGSRKSPVQSRSKVTVDAILRATGLALVEHGYEATTTNLVAQIAGVSIGSLYQYFPSKDALLAALVENHVDQMNRVLRSQLTEVAAKPLPVVIRTMVKAVFDAHAVDPRLHGALMAQARRVGRDEKLLQIDREMQALIGALLAVRGSELRRERLEAAAVVLVKAIEGVTHSAVCEERPAIPPEHVMEELTDMVSRYLLA